MPAPLAGKPPFATDEPDSLYDASPASPPKRRMAPPKPDNPNARSSAYNVYDNYLAPGDNNNRPTSVVSTASRNSAIGALGMGLLAMDDSDDDDSDDEEAFERRRRAERAKAALIAELDKSHPAPTSSSSANKSPSKTLPSSASSSSLQTQSRSAALAAAISSNANDRNRAVTPSPPPSPPPIAAPKPGYAGPTIATLGVGKSPSPIENPFEPKGQGHPQGQQGQHMQGQPQRQNSLGGPQLGAPPQMQQRGPPPGGPGFRGPPGLNINLGLPMPNGNNPNGNVHGHGHANGPLTPPPSAIVRGMTPAPLAPPMTPITPVFAMPKSSASSVYGGSDAHGEKDGFNGVRWDDLPPPTPRKPIMRSGTEDALLPSRGEKGDDFWRRFSMVAKAEGVADGRKKESPWLRKTTSGKNRLGRWVWVIGVVLLAVIGAAIGLGVWFGRNSPDHQQPGTLAGGAGTMRADDATSTSSVKGGASATTAKIVTPTHTVKERGFTGNEVVVRTVDAVDGGLPTPAPTPTAGVVEKHRRHGHMKKRF
ncbi:hypothetical protein DFP72DRAFT_607791 [Ephemerocybe angulata]|uniref:Uncharacterized protein n=1 Tax=Ephemerocybe angulata TaxID=980116 RepID=A0A8H6LZ80_9AGAR|nr:hypothetical protein DFP72DRAFT_607791 [Tulosesus angulatus]